MATSLKPKSKKEKRKTVLKPKSKETTDGDRVESVGVRATKTKTLLQEAVQAGHVPKARRPYAVFFAEQCAMMLPSAGCRQTHRNHVSRIGASRRSLSIRAACGD